MDLRFYVAIIAVLGYSAWRVFYRLTTGDWNKATPWPEAEPKEIWKDDSDADPVE